MQLLKKLEDTVASWPQISIYSHRFGGREFRLASAEVGHVHEGGIVDIPFPRSIRDALLTEGLAEEHHWVPNSGWVTFHVRSDQDLQHAVWLMRLSYFRYALKTAANPRELFVEATQELQLTPGFKSLLEQFVPLTEARIGRPAAGTEETSGASR
ncbi:MAG: luciferase family protein [Candidatus Acidiferrum sp.]